MKYFRNLVTGEVFAFEPDGSQDEFIGLDLVPMNPAEVEAHLSQPALTREQIEAAERAWRDTAVATVLWLRERHRDEQDLQRSTTLSGERFTELLTYLQSLRDWPQSAQFPEIERRPVAPSWIAEQT
ncbi:phage tail assembly chaperone [Pseudomonas sp. CCOS 191]|uniref:phage tail assembly chaperone n=1 Tax=Pseudomonas sp. CCOS 191 TaxID=1649877 RepID=UPI000624EAE9|nr:phage tail assembly chaperone [Pseudomonas sp. CCOS 191]CRI58059.1 hypothetical protein CCOS191_3523 [Pseudomonas sp. CCOS 191]